MLCKSLGYQSFSLANDVCTRFSLREQGCPFPCKSQGQVRNLWLKKIAIGVPMETTREGTRKKKCRAKRIMKDTSQHLSQSLLPRSWEGDLGRQNPHDPGYWVLGLSHSDISDLGLPSLDSTSALLPDTGLWARISSIAIFPSPESLEIHNPHLDLSMYDQSVLLNDYFFLPSHPKISLAFSNNNKKDIKALMS